MEQKCRKYAKIASIWVIVNHAMTFAALIYSLYFISIGNFDTSKWILPLDLSVPFGIEHLFGWYSLWTFNLLINFQFGACLAAVIIHFICVCSYIMGICKDINLKIQSIQQKNQVAPKKSRTTKQVTETFCQVIDTQVKAFE